MNLDPVFEQKPLLMYWVAQENLIEFLLQNGLSYILQIIVYVFLILVYPKAITSIFYDVLHVTWLCDLSHTEKSCYIGIRIGIPVEIQ